LRCAALGVSLRRTRSARSVGPAASLLLISVLVAVLVPLLIPAALRSLTLGSRTLLRRRTPALRLGPLLPVVRPAAATTVVPEPAFAFAARAVGVEFLLGAPGDFAAAGVVFRHERGG